MIWKCLVRTKNKKYFWNKIEAYIKRVLPYWLIKAKYPKIPKTNKQVSRKIQIVAITIIFKGVNT